jgi:hypothetical protein
MDGNADAYSAFLHSLPPDRVLPSQCQDLVSRDENQPSLVARCEDPRPDPSL